MELINNTTKTLKNDLSVEIKQGSKLSIAAACFSIYAFQELKEQLSQIEQLRFIFTSPTFVTEKAKKERREFYIPRLTRERSLYGTEFEIKLRNELTQKAIARECAEWIRQKVTFKSNVSDKSIQGQIVVDSVGYTPINNFTTVELGCEKGNVISTTIVKDESLARTLLADFNEIWNDSKVLQVVTDEVIDSITAAYNENSPDFIYFVTLYNIFNEFLEDVSEDVLPNEATGFKGCLQLYTDNNCYVLDFFSGSATTAHAVMQLNAEDGGHRKFIMVQLPEVTDEKSEAYKAGYKTICEIGKERIRRAGAKIKEEAGLTAQNLDVGFRVLKCDTSNMKAVYYNPAEYEASLFSRLEDNIKEDRTPEDLLFQVMLDLGVLLSGKIEETTIAGKKVFNVEDNYLIACFDSDVTEETITAIAKQKPYYFVMRDSSMANDSVATNFDQIFATYSPDTVRKVL